MKSTVDSAHSPQILERPGSWTCDRGLPPCRFAVWRTSGCVALGVGPCVGARRSPGALCVVPRRSVCRAAALSVGKRRSPGALCVGERRSVSGPGTLCVGARRSPALCVGSLSGVLVRGPGVFVCRAGRRSLCVRGPPLVCVGARRSLCRARALSVSGRARRSLCRAGLSRRSPCRALLRASLLRSAADPPNPSSDSRATSRALRGPQLPSPSNVPGPRAPQLGSACHPAQNCVPAIRPRPPAPPSRPSAGPIRVPPIRSAGPACHPSSPARSLSPGENPTL